MYRFSKKVSLSKLTWKIPWTKPTFTKFVEAANNLTKLVEVGKHFTKFLKFANNFTKFEEFTNNEVRRTHQNFTKSVGLASNFYEVRRSCEQL